MDKVAFDLNGLKEIDDLLKNLPLSVQAQLLRGINRKAAKIVQLQMKAGTTVEGINIKIKADKYNKSGVLVGVENSDRGFLARFLEYGTQIRSTKDGENRGSIQPNPFLKKAIDSKANEVINFLQTNYATEINKGLERRVKAVNKKINK